MAPRATPFCTKENLDYAVALTTQRLQATGLPALPVLRTLEEDNRVRLVNLLDSVLRLKDVRGRAAPLPHRPCPSALTSSSPHRPVQLGVSDPTRKRLRRR